MVNMNPLYQNKTLQIFHVVVSITIVLSVFMIILGGVVKNTGSSMICPDWPTCNGEWFPTLVGKVGLEHGHRILGSILGFLSIATLLLAFKLKVANENLLKLSLVALIIVIAQGLLGAATVYLNIHPAVSTFHLSLSHLYFALLLYLQHLSRPMIVFAKSQKPSNSMILKLKLAAIVLFSQIVLGASIRHFGAGTACGLGWESAVQCLSMDTAELAFWPSHFKGRFHMLHRYWGLFTALFLIWASLPTLKWAKAVNLKFIKIAVILLHAVITLQVLIGAKVIGSGLANYAISIHLFLALFLWTVVLKLNFWQKDYSKKDLIA